MLPFSLLFMLSLDAMRYVVSLGRHTYQQACLLGYECTLMSLPFVRLGCARLRTKRSEPVWLNCCERRPAGKHGACIGGGFTPGVVSTVVCVCVCVCVFGGAVVNKRKV